MKHLWDYQVNDSLPSREWWPTDLQLRQYAEASGDFNPIHLDEAFARKAGFDGIIAHGMLTMAQLGAMLTDWISEEGTLKSFEVRFKNMVRVGERIVFSGYIKDALSDAVKCDLIVTKANGEEVLTGSAEVSFKTKDSFRGNNINA
ncbi:MaoC/PaaZ C-terminal domain-containing protein [Desulfosporosinus sp. BICA1-9]|uniref:MaoC/PaaZ C-terminal domain-containing protein n=1 Tax=Desulfosporosinus sp. BICA1-9 TaxID=1531958 RepID=UPI0005F220D7|nr:MaoC/PaaZ C-terminal domain-containing protein [Desulfosporosinus sp. BICA1-9]KJS47910.1 MAG: acyl dehydratase [Peptococcaceae bacterium BRH_c23]KJS82545.1 MAG: acyl dehydratase [Desulfosporosinus sp. BICA1-9]HBW35777.1 acyl dehydratase [Desulfosporosinus sp.]